jgi:GWxTD domain-containing protein
VRAAAAALALGLFAGCAAAPPAAIDFDNVHLSPALAPWLVGPIARIATPEEVRAYLALTDDAAAESFIEAFWARRDPDPARPGNRARDLFDQRAREADRRFSEAGYLGRRTDRGTLFVLFGEPGEIDYEISPREGGPPVERWSYGGTTVTSLAGRPPAAVYRFVKKGDLTVLYLGPGTSEPSPLTPPPG